MTVTDIRITINDVPRLCPGGTSCRDILAEVTGQDISVGVAGDGGGAVGVAIAVDGQVIPQSLWATTHPAEGARVEVVGAVQGG